MRKDICSDLLESYEAEGEAFLSCIVTADETWLHHLEPETKRQSRVWHHTTSHRSNKFKAIPSADKVIVMASVFWDSGG